MHHRTPSSPPRAALGWLLALLLGLLLPRAAAAADVVVLELDGFGVAYEEAALAAEGFRQALAADRRYKPVDPYDLSDRLTAGHRDDLDRAREEVRKARIDLDAGDPGLALERLNEALDLHLAAGSDLSRRGELADAYAYMGIALVQLGAGEAAVEPFFEAERLYPGYLFDRAPPMTGYARELFEQARAERLGGPRFSLSLQDLDDIAREAQADAILSGYIESDGSIVMRLVEDGRLIGELRVRAREVPPYPGDPVYDDWVKELLADVAPPPSGRERVSRDRDRGDDRAREEERAREEDRRREEERAREEDRRREEERAREEDRGGDDLDDLDDLVAARADRREGGARREREREDRIDGASARPPRASNSRRWIFVAGGAVIAGGAVASVVAINANAEPAGSDSLSPRYTVVLVKSASGAGDAN